VGRVHVSVDRSGALGPPWSDAGVDSGHGGVLTGARPPAAPARVQQREERTGNTIRASPGLERRRGGRATTVQSGEMAALSERVAQAGREGNVSGERCGELWGGCSTFIGAGGKENVFPAKTRLMRGLDGPAEHFRPAGDDEASGLAGLRSRVGRKVGRAEIKKKEFLN
jgi:hypothetical protein